MTLPTPGNEQNLVVVARLLRPRGNRGELAAEPVGDCKRRFEDLADVFVGGRALRVESAWWHGDRLVLKFAGVDSISAAGALAGLDVEVTPDRRVPLDEGAYYVADLVGCRVVEKGTGEPVGVVAGWEDFGGPLLLRVETDAGKEVLIPFARAICVSIDPEARRIEVDLPDGLRELNG